MEPIKLIAVYARVSSTNQENEGTIETQLLAIKEFARAHNYSIVKEYHDDGWSGDNLSRPNLDQLRMDAKKKIWEAVLIYDPDRLARRYSYQELVTDELREAGIEVVFVTTPAPKNGVEKILFGVQGLFAEYERAKIAERFRLGKVRKAREGHIITSEAPYGLIFIPKSGKRGDADYHEGYYQINELELPILKRIFTWVDEGMTLRSIVRKLQELGITPRKSKRGVWNTSTLSTLLRNKTYIGEGHFGATYAVVPENPLKKEGYKKIKKSSRKIRPEEEWIKIPTPKVIDADLFFRVGQKLKSNFDLSKRNTKNEYLLAGKIWCTCGRRRAGEGPQHGKHLYYRCTDRVYSFPLASTCIEKGINARIADALVWEDLAALMSSPTLILQQAKRWLSNQQSQNSDSTIDVESVRREIIKLKEQETRYGKAYGGGVISLEQLQEYSLPIKERILSLESQLAKARLEIKGKNEFILPGEHEIESFAEKARNTLGDLNFPTRKAIVRGTVEKIIATKQQLIVYGNIPINEDVAFCSNNRNSMNTIRNFVGRVVPFKFQIPLQQEVRELNNMLQKAA